MAAHTICNLCGNPGTLQNAAEIGRVPCDVRYFAGKLFTIWRCANCNSVHSADDVMLSDYYSRYPLQRQKLDLPIRVGYRSRLRLLKRHGIRRTTRILDYGCGAGLFVQFLKQKGFGHAYGYDPFVAAHADRQILRERFDAVVSFDVIEHADDTKEFLSRLKDRVRPHGIVVIGTPNADYVSVCASGLPDIEISQPYHRHILSERALLDLAQSRGLRPLRVYRRVPMDSLIPGINTRFMWTYIRHTGGTIDAAVEPPRLGIILRSPALLFAAFFGSFYPPRGNMVVVFRRE